MSKTLDLAGLVLQSYRDEIKDLRRLVADLQAQLRNKQT